MFKEKFVAIGHITNDLSPKEHLGGGVSYSAVAASRLGLDAHIVTKCPTTHPYVDQLRNLGVSVHALPSSNKITTFDNKYDLWGNRRQIVSEIAESISPKDDIPWDVLDNSIILVAPVTPVDVDMKLFLDLAKCGSVSVAPQGYIRDIGRNGVVSQGKWQGFEKYLSNTKAVILSEEDLSNDGKFDKDLKEKIVNSTPLVAITKGEKGASVFEGGKEVCDTKSFPLGKKELVDFTGAGDVFATIFIIEMAKNSGDIRAASVAACLFSAIKIMGIGGIGIDSIPTRKQIAEFIGNNPQRVNSYIKTDALKPSKLSLHMLK